MKRTYIAPQCEVIALKPEGMIASSAPDKHDEYSSQPSLAPKRDDIWSASQHDDNWPAGN